MQINITGRHMDVTDGLRSIVERKAEKLGHIMDHIIEIHVILAVDKLDHVAECTVSSDMKTFFCQAHSGDMYESVDRLFAKVDRQIRRYIDKMTTLKNHDRISEHVESTVGEVEQRPVLVRVEEVSPKPMATAEAVMQLNALQKEYGIFIDASDPSFREAVVFRNGSGYIMLLPSDHGWTQHALHLDASNHVAWSGQTHYHVPDLSVEQAISKVHEYQLDRQVFYDSDQDSINILYRTGHGLGLLTSGEGVYRGGVRPELAVM